jgi:hypothetical protein
MNNHIGSMKYGGTGVEYEGKRGGRRGEDGSNAARHFITYSSGRGNVKSALGIVGGGGGGGGGYNGPKEMVCAGR